MDMDKFFSSDIRMIMFKMGMHGMISLEIL